MKSYLSAGMVIAFGFGILATGCSREDSSAESSDLLEVTYYYLPECSICVGIRPLVTGLDQDFPGQVTAQNLNCQTQPAKEEIAKLGFATHGIAIHDAQGKLLFSQADHTVKMDEVRTEIEQRIGSGW